MGSRWRGRRTFFSQGSVPSTSTSSSQRVKDPNHRVSLDPNLESKKNNPGSDRQEIWIKKTGSGSYQKCFFNRNRIRNLGYGSLIIILAAKLLYEPVCLSLAHSGVYLYVLTLNVVVECFIKEMLLFYISKFLSIFLSLRLSFFLYVCLNEIYICKVSLKFLILQMLRPWGQFFLLYFFSSAKLSLHFSQCRRKSNVCCSCVPIGSGSGSGSATAPSSSFSC